MSKPALQIISASLLVVGGAVFAAHAHAGKTLDAIKQRDQVVCGVNTGLAGFSAADSQGNLGRPRRRRLQGYRGSGAGRREEGEVGSAQRAAALHRPAVGRGRHPFAQHDVHADARRVARPLHDTVVTYYDGQGFIVPKKGKITSAKQLKNAEVCVQSGTTTEKNLTDYFKSIDVKIKPVVFEGFEASVKAFFSGRCQAYTTDASGLASIRNKEAPNPDDYVILPELISKEPLGPMVRRGDDEWFAMVKWTIYALLEAEEYGHHAGERRPDEIEHRIRRFSASSARPRTRASCWAWTRSGLTGRSSPSATTAKSSSAMSGPQSALKLPRGLNNQWNKGGIMYAPPIR